MSARNSLVPAVQRYLRERRQLGFAMTAPATELMRFAQFADRHGHQGPLTQELQIAWAREHVQRTSVVTAARRLEILRPFVTHYRQFEVASEIPPTGALGRGHRRLVPHIYTDEELRALLEAARAMDPTGGIRAIMNSTLFGLIAATGLRLSEALQLNIEDVDLVGATITIRQTKFCKSRCLPIDVSVVQALVEYRQTRDRFADCDATAPLFLSCHGRRLPASTARYVFNCIRSQLHWRARGDHTHPRIHDLRHTFAVRRVQRWREEGLAIEHGIFWLCTYLGHAKVSDTYWYLTGVPELMNLVGMNYERFAYEGGNHE